MLHMHTHSLHRPKAAPSLFVGKELARSTPGYFGKLPRTCVSCKYFSPSAPLTQKRSCAVMGAPGEEQRGLCQAPREEEGAQEHWHLLTVTSRKQGSGGKEESDMD